jgi:hypothetical protein
MVATEVKGLDALIPEDCSIIACHQHARHFLYNLLSIAVTRCGARPRATPPAKCAGPCGPAGEAVGAQAQAVGDNLLSRCCALALRLPQLWDDEPLQSAMCAQSHSCVFLRVTSSDQVSPSVIGRGRRPSTPGDQRAQHHDARACPHAPKRPTHLRLDEISSCPIRDLNVLSPPFLADNAGVDGDNSTLGMGDTAFDSEILEYLHPTYTPNVVPHPDREHSEGGRPPATTGWGA